MRIMLENFTFREKNVRKFHNQLISTYKEKMLENFTYLSAIKIFLPNILQIKSTSLEVTNIVYHEVFKKYKH